VKHVFAVFPKQQRKIPSTLAKRMNDYIPPHSETELSRGRKIHEWLQKTLVRATAGTSKHMGAPPGYVHISEGSPGWARLPETQGWHNFRFALPFYPEPYFFAHATMKPDLAFANVSENREKKALIVMELQNNINPMRHIHRESWMKWWRARYKGWHAALLLTAARYAQEHGLDLYVTMPQHHKATWGGVAQGTADNIYGRTPKNVAKGLGTRIEKVNAVEELGIKLVTGPYKGLERATRTGRILAGTGLRHPYVWKINLPKT
jgi:hypothetical protein